MVPSRILICRLSAIGDCVETWPIATALKNYLPECEITWVVDCGVDSLLREHSCIDHVIRLPKGWLKRPTILWQLRSQLRSKHIEVAIDPQGLSKSSLIAWLSGARRRIGFAPPVAKEISPWIYTEAIAPQRTHLVDRQLELLTPFGIRPERIDFGYRVNEEMRTWWKQMRNSLGIQKPYAVINAGAGWESRVWDMGRYAEVAKFISSQGIIPLVLWGGAKEQTMAEEIVAISGGAAMMSPAANLVQLSAILYTASFYVGSESGPMHMAAALGTPCISLHGPTLAVRSGPYGDEHLPIQKEYSPAQRKTSGNEALLKITADDVIEKCAVMIDRTRFPARAAA